MKKLFSHLSMRTIMTLLVVAEMGLVLVVALILAALLRYFSKDLLIPYWIWLPVIAISLGYVITFFLSKWLFAPITRLGKAMRQVAAGHFDTRLENGSPFREIDDIYANFNRMAGELQATEILQTDFVSNVSHEFKTPINAIEGYAVLLQGTDGAATPQQAQYIEKILFNTRRLSRLVGNILLLSKVDNQAIQTKPTTFRLDEQIRQSILLLEPEWAPKDIEFDVEMPRLEYTGSEGLLLQVWNNLIGNAVKFDPPGGAVRIRLERQPGRVVFTVADTGPGIPPEAQKHIFDRFYQSDSSHRAEGNGLGLALVRQILEVCGGTVAVENLPEAGCRFTVTLPENGEGRK